MPGLRDDRLLMSLAAGFGGMALVRSKFFSIRTEKGEDVAVGPDAAISAFLNAADRGVDRVRASRRLALVTDRARRVGRPDLGPDFVTISLAALQNLSTEEKKTVREAIEKVKAEPYSDELKLQAHAGREPGGPDGEN